MTLTIELNPTEEGRLVAAARLRGVEPEELAKSLVSEHLPSSNVQVPDAENQALINLLRSWREEDRTEDIQELERRDTATQELLHNLEVNRLALRTPEE